MELKNYIDLDFCKENITQNITFYELTKIATIHILLKFENSLSGDVCRLSGSEIWDYSKKYFGEIVDSQGKIALNDQQRDTFIQYLSKLVRDPESPINRDGQRNNFYIDFDKIVQANAPECDSKQRCNQPESNSKVRVARELTLYPILQSWLVTNSYQAADVSNEKQNGRWGNPDLAGIKVSESFKGLSFELITIEVKVNSKDWEKVIFEAVSHRRFANRVYFAYADKKSRQFVQLEDIKYYSELYKVGILKLILDDADYEKLINGNECSILSSNNVDVIEVCSAPYNIVQESFQLKFCDNLGIRSQKDLYSWGRKDN